MPTYPRPACRSLENEFTGRDIALVTDCYTFHSCRDISAEPNLGLVTWRIEEQLNQGFRAMANRLPNPFTLRQAQGERNT